MMMSSYLRKHRPSAVDQRHQHDGAVAVLERPAEVAPPTMHYPAKPEPLPDFVASLTTIADVPARDPGEVEYEALAAELGFRPHEMDLRRMERESRAAEIELNRIGIEVSGKLQSKRIPRYDVKEVASYMTPGMMWVWKPLGHDGSMEIGHCPSGAISGLVYFTNGEIGEFRDLALVRSSNQYTKLIPIHILRRIKVVKDLFASEDPKFYVTDYEVPNPDPFVKVVVRGYSAIFGMWDEPGFGDLKTEV